jgi:cation transport regulator
MPYASNDQLPPSVRSHLPPRAQDIYREAFNDAWRTYGGELRREEIVHRIAWAVVERRYEKSEDGEWRPKE